LSRDDERGRRRPRLAKGYGPSCWTGPPGWRGKRERVGPGREEGLGQREARVRGKVFFYFI
jgi:hypothetical protein